MEFLYWYLETQWQSNIYTEGYGTDRAFADGKAKAFEELHTILKQIEGSNVKVETL